MNNERTSYFKRTLVMLMAVIMVFTYMPTMAWADSSGESTDADAVAIAAVTLDGATADLVVDDTATMTAPEAGEGETVTWTSSNSNVATVNNGTVTAKAVGTATITAKGYIKVTTSLDKSDKASISDLKDAGYTVKYRFYRSTKKAAGYKSTVTKKASTYTNTTGKKGTKYFYKVQVRVYDASGKLAAKTALKQCKYASRVWTK